MQSSITFNVGDKVVYPAHGVGEITGCETQVVVGTEISMYVIEFEQEKMTLRVPTNRVEASGLRPLNSESTVVGAIDILKGRARAGRGMWSRRAQEYEAKIHSGDITAIAEVVRDLHKNVDDPDRSYSERVIYESALGRLAGEYAAVKKLTHAKAIDSLEAILKSRKDASKKKQAATLSSLDEELLHEAEAA